ncbi:hypothetical protein [Brevibacterium oceani]|uniref:hypothetical protein n=1 Tax=Brevibacterium oceani TaxID=358099 RepID=UPI0015E73B35|nr:hypothetical protein [Brevibacterium oceani]
MTSTASAAPLTDVAVGDIVSVARVLDHPAWKNQRGVAEDLGDCAVIDVRHVPAIPGPWGAREAKTLIRAHGGFWYDAATGLQENSGATRIEPADRKVG